MPTELSLTEQLPWQKELWFGLQTRRQRDRYPHALLLQGPEGVGKRHFAKQLAAALVCQSDAALEKQPCGNCHACHLAETGTHPDIQWITPEQPGKMIRVDAIRGLIGRSVLTSQGSASRTFLIEPADAMNVAAANSLLKTLEEPVASTRLILISSRPHLLPATIRSRCQALTFKPADADLAQRWLQQKLDSLEQVSQCLALCGGAPLLALRAAEEDWLADALQTLDDLQGLKTRQQHPLQIAEQWSARPFDRLLQHLARILADLAMLCAGIVQPRLFHPSALARLQTLAEGLDLVRLLRFNDELNQLRRRAAYNLNAAMSLEKMINDWLVSTRPDRGGQG